MSPIDTASVDVAALLDRLDPAWNPVALAGCRLGGTGSKSCAHDLVVFDGSGRPPEVLRRADRTVIIYRASLNETRPAALVGCLNMRILRDHAMSLAPFLEDVRRRRDGLILSRIRDGAAGSVLCAQRALQERGADAASCWQKCATLYLSDAALLSEGILPSSHALDGLRHARSNIEIPALVHRSLGVERSTPSLLKRMGESAAGLSGMTGAPTPDVVRFKTASMLRDGRLTDCYYYLCGVGRDAMTGAGSHTGSRTGSRAGDWATIQYASRICLDAERDGELVRANALEVRDAAGGILRMLANKQNS